MNVKQRRSADEILKHDYILQFISFEFQIRSGNKTRLKTKLGIVYLISLYF